jgi:L-proline---[L-prolyl-carrier protein] ligase
VPVAPLIHHGIAAAAARHPDAPAIVDDTRVLTYRRLLAWAGGFAETFTAALPPGGRVALNLRKSPAAIAAMIGTLQAGCTYVPIDPASPMLRRRFILRDSNAAALVVDGATSAEWLKEPQALAELALVVSPGAAVPASRRAPLEAAADVLPAVRERRPVAGSDLAYILYTSGSTGEPKGVMITHENAAQFVAWASNCFDIGPSDRIAIHAPLHFDLPVLDIYLGLARGACLFPVSDVTARFPEALAGFLRERDITVLYAVPSALSALISRSTLTRSGLPALRLLLYAGEEFHATPLARLMAAVPQARVFNLYGPIETNVVTAYEVAAPPAKGERVPIGYPIPGTRIFVLDPNGAVITTPSVEGEIAVSGPTVSPGYLNRPELTTRTRRVVHDEQGECPAYRTGDFGFWGHDGELHFIGRRDGVVKTRGFRVDLGDVEAAMSSHDAVAEAAVVAVPHPDYTTQLLGFAVPVPDAPLDEAMLVAWCRARLPAYMIPERIAIRAQLPRTSTGKISRRALVSEHELVEP